MKLSKDWTDTSRWWTTSLSKRRLIGGCGARWASRWSAAWMPGRRGNARICSGYEKPREQGGSPNLYSPNCREGMF